MMCLLHLQDGVVHGWIVGTDAHDIRRQAEGNAWADPRMHGVVSELYAREFWPAGKHPVADGFLLLVT